jgi:RNA polymerase sigma-70 factor (ECF subfamily)
VAASFLSERADVEDVAQETFLRALDRIRTYDPDRPFAPWLYQIARNVARNRIAGRARRKTEPLPDEGLAGGADDPEAELERSEIRRRVDAAVAGLPERQRAVFRLLDVEGFSAAEAAEMLGLTSGTVRSHLSHARSALREALAPWLERTEES